jgi:small-conductance mechanosensitive channel
MRRARGEPNVANDLQSGTEREAAVAAPSARLGLRSATAIVVLAALAATIYGWLTTAQPGPGAPGTAAEHTPEPPSGTIVDQTPLLTAQAVATRATTPDQQRLAGEAIATANHLLDLSYADALREVTEHPKPLSAKAQTVEARLKSIADRLVQDNAEVVRLTAALAEAKPDQQDDLTGALELAKAQFAVDQDAYNQAGRDLLDAGGDPRGQIEAMVAEHEAAPTKPNMPALTAAATGAGLVAEVREWWDQEEERRAVEHAGFAAKQAAADLTVAQSKLQEAIEAQRKHSPAAAAASVPAARPREESAALLAATKSLASDQKNLISLSVRRAAHEKLETIYGDWSTLASAEARSVLHRVLHGVGWILLVCLLLLFFDRWLTAALVPLRLERRQMEMLRTVIAVGLQVVAVIAVGLIVLGPPRQLGTILGLAGAGLTVALKDFIVAFVGWLVLMGRNGIRQGDWVEIRGVTGEVIQLGMLHTVLLETGNWTDTGHPTGRRVTFTNAYAIEGHYFNFSTSGQWLWDELSLTVASGQDPYAIVDAIRRTVMEATGDNASKAEAEWRKAAPSRELSGLSAEPAINIKPVVGGTEVAVRYITRASERYRLRAQLYEAAVKLFGQKPT